MLRSQAIPVPFEMCSPTRVCIRLEDFWEVARLWAHLHGFVKVEGAYQGAPSV